MTEENATQRSGAAPGSSPVFVLPTINFHLPDLPPADDADESAMATRKSIVASAQRSDSAKRKVATRRSSHHFPVQSFHDILQDLGTLCRNQIRIPEFESEFEKLTLATPYQKHVFELPEVTPD